VNGIITSRLTWKRKGREKKKTIEEKEQDILGTDLDEGL